LNTEILIITIISFVSGTVTASLGFGAGLLLTPLLTFIMPVKEALAVSSLVFLVTSASKAFIYRKMIDRGIYRKGLFLSMTGLTAGALSVSIVNPFWLEKFLGFALLYFSFNAFMKRDNIKSILPVSVFPVLGGFMSIMSHAGGAFFFRYCRLNNLSRMETVGTLAGVHFTLNIFKAIFFTTSGFAATHYVYTLIPAYAASVAGTYTGRHILKNYMNEDLFVKAVAVVLLLIALRFLLHF